VQVSLTLTKAHLDWLWNFHFPERFQADLEACCFLLLHLLIDYFLTNVH
jgi:hypothetical protein